MIGDYRYRLNSESPLPRRVGRYLLLVSAAVVIPIAGLSMGLLGPDDPTDRLVSESKPLTQPLALPDSANAADKPAGGTQPGPVMQNPTLAAAADTPVASSDSEPRAQTPSGPVVVDAADSPVGSERVSVTHPPALPEQTESANQPGASLPPVAQESGAPAVADPPPQETPDPAVKSEPLSPSPSALTHTVRSGDTLSRIFDDLGLSAALLHRIIESDPEAKRLAKIKPGQKLQFVLDPEGRFSELTYVMDAVSSLQVEDGEEGLKTRMLNKQVERRTTHASGVITSSLFAAGQKAGLSESKIMELAGLFGWDIDFSLELRSGDSFTVVFEEDYLEDMKFRDGPILAAEFVNQGKTYRAIRYQDPSGHVDYYSPDGNSMRKAFLRSPIKFARISSRFTKGRKHPILGKTRAHKGVDYAAPAGTPIRAAGEGTISFRGKKGGYGKTIIVEHGNGKSTLYAHMSRYAPNKKKGKRVKQGDVIGYVGSTGLATGPHLHYEFRIDGVHRNPLTVKLPIAKPIEKKYRDDFHRKTDPLMAQLDNLSRTLVADAR